MNARAPSRVAKSLTMTIVFGSPATRLTEWPVAPCDGRVAWCSLKPRSSGRSRSRGAGRSPSPWDAFLRVDRPCRRSSGPLLYGRHRIVNTRIMAPMAKIQMPPDFHEQTPEANVLATEAVMNTIRTAEWRSRGSAGSSVLLTSSAAGGLVLGQLRDHGAMSPSELGDRLIVTRATVTGLVDRSSGAGSSAVGEPGRPPEPAGRDHPDRPRGGPAGPNDHPSQGDGLDERAVRCRVRAYIALLHRIQDSIAAGGPGRSGAYAPTGLACAASSAPAVRGTHGSCQWRPSAPWATFRMDRTPGALSRRSATDRRPSWRSGRAWRR